MVLEAVTETPETLLRLSKAAFSGRARLELEAIENELYRRRWAVDWNLWAQERAGSFLWSKQKEILQALQTNRKVAVRSCHGIGKSFTAAHAVAAWLDTHPPGTAAAVTSAPTARQVRAILWKEIRRVHSRSGLPGRTNQTEWYLTPPGEGEQLVAVGMKPDDYSPTAFQGIHARFLLVVFDEACGIQGRTEDIQQTLWEGADSLLSNDECRFLAIGNPDDSQTEFARICSPGSGWKVLGVGAFETPNFTGEEIPDNLKAVLIGHAWVEEKRKAWASTWKWNEARTKVIPPKGLRIQDAHPLWLSKVLGLFPENKESRGLIPIAWIQAAQDRTLVPSGPNELGVDVGGGGDSSTIAHRRGPVVRILHEDHNPDTMQTCGTVISFLRKTKASSVKVDPIGIGRGIVDRGKEQNLPFSGVNVGEAANDPEAFLNRRAELWWAVRDRFEKGEVDLDPEDQELLSELVSLRFSRTSRGQVQIESKDAAKKRGIQSPNRADALMLAFAPEREEKSVPKGGLIW